MQKEIFEIVKNVFIQYVKEYDENKGDIFDFLNHLEKAFEKWERLPKNVQSKLGNMALQALTVAEFFRRY